MPSVECPACGDEVPVQVMVEFKSGEVCEDCRDRLREAMKPRDPREEREARQRRREERRARERNFERMVL